MSWNGVNSGVSRNRPLRMASIARKFPTFRSETQARADSGRAERPVVRLDIAEHLLRAQPGTRRDLRHQAGLVAELRVRRSRVHLHALDRAGRDCVENTLLC